MMRYLLVLLAVCGMAAAQEQPLFFGESDVIGQRFVLDTLNGEKIASQREIYIEFPARDQVAGRICNNFRGPCTVERYILTADIASTRMLCPDEKLRELENKFFQYMRLGIGFIRSGDRLEFRRDDTSIAFRLAGEAGKDAPARSEPAPEQPEGAAAPGVAEKDLAGRKFVLATADGEPFSVTMGKQPFIEFGEGFRVSGSACNGFTGPGSLEGGKLFLRNAASTMMMCVDEKLSGYERDFHAMLREGADISLEGGELTLSGNGKTYIYAEEK